MPTKHQKHDKDERRTHGGNNKKMRKDKDDKSTHASATGRQADDHSQEKKRNS